MTKTHLDDGEHNYTWVQPVFLVVGKTHTEEEGNEKPLPPADAVGEPEAKRLRLDQRKEMHDWNEVSKRNLPAPKTVLVGFAIKGKPLKEKWNRSKLFLHDEFFDFLEQQGASPKKAWGRFKRNAKASSNLEALIAYAANELLLIQKEQMKKSERTVEKVGKPPVLVQMRHGQTVGTVVRVISSGGNWDGELDIFKEQEGAEFFDSGIEEWKFVDMMRQIVVQKK
jgi:hypothetical protein